MVCLLLLNVYMRKIYEEDKNKKSFYKVGKKGCCWAKNASSQIKQMFDFQEIIRVIKATQMIQLFHESHGARE